MVVINGQPQKGCHGVGPITDGYDRVARSLQHTGGGDLGNIAGQGFFALPLQKGTLPEVNATCLHHQEVT